MYKALTDEYVPNNQMNKAHQLNDLSMLKLKKNEDQKKLRESVLFM